MTVVENRRFLVRAVRLLADELGIRQFLNIGTGIPTSPNVHEVAQSIAPESRVVYVDNDPIVLAHARALLRSGHQGPPPTSTPTCVTPTRSCSTADLLRTLDLSQPVALMLVAILHFIADGDDPHGVVARLVGAMAPGSYLVVSHATSDFMPPEAAAAVADEGSQSRVPFRFRTKQEIARFLEGLEILPPGIQSLSEWRAESEPQPRPSAADIAGYAAVARIG